MTKIVETPEGFEFTLDGRRHGTWRSRAEAAAGLETELARQEQREAEESACEIAYIDQRTQDLNEWRNRDH